MEQTISTQLYFCLQTVDPFKVQRVRFGSGGCRLQPTEHPLPHSKKATNNVEGPFRSQCSFCPFLASMDTWRFNNRLWKETGSPWIHKSLNLR